jgi:hypothetical protein
MEQSRSNCVFFAASLLIAGIAASASPAFAQSVTRADVNRDCTVTSADAALVQAALGKRTGQPGYSANADVNSDGVINAVDLDLAFVNRNLNARVCSAPPPAAPTIVATVSPAANANGWHNTNVTIAFMCTNATTCPGPAAVSTEGANQAIERTVTNAAGAPHGVDRAARARRQQNNDALHARVDGAGGCGDRLRGTAGNHRGRSRGQHRQRASRTSDRST